MSTSIASAGRRVLPNQWDLIALAVIMALLTTIAQSYHGISAPLSASNETISLDYWNLPYYALRTALRMFAALFFSIMFTFPYAALAAKSRRAEMVLIPVLDILQSVPVMGFLAFTVTFFLGLFPGNTMGAELAAIFAIFSNQAWNMTFSLYQSLRTVPPDLDEVARGLRLTGWQKFWQLETPFAMPGLIWNAMISMSTGWFYVVASEAITVGNTTITLPGVGSYIAKANNEGNWAAIGAAVLTMAIVILLYDQLLFRPIVAWGDKFRVELTAGQEVSTSRVLNILRRTYWIRAGFRPIAAGLLSISFLPIRFPRFRRERRRAEQEHPSRVIDALWRLGIAVVAVYAAWLTVSYVRTEVGWSEVGRVFILTVYTFIRVVLLILVASLVWVPISVWIGLRPRWTERIQPIAQFLAAFPANLMFGAAVSLVLAYHLNPNIWLSFLMIFGTQWFIVFSTIGGAAAYPEDLKEVAENFHIHGWRWWWKVILPGIAPYYVTGAITASGGAWNAAIVAEYVTWKKQTVIAEGVGSYILEATNKGDYPRIVLGVAMMSIFVALINRLFWRQLYAYTERRLRL